MISFVRRPTLPLSPAERQLERQLTRRQNLRGVAGLYISAVILSSLHACTASTDRPDGAPEALTSSPSSLLKTALQAEGFKASQIIDYAAAQSQTKLITFVDSSGLCPIPMYAEYTNAPDGSIKLYDYALDIPQPIEDAYSNASTPVEYYQDRATFMAKVGVAYCTEQATDQSRS